MVQRRVGSNFGPTKLSLALSSRRKLLRRWNHNERRNGADGPVRAGFCSGARNLGKFHGQDMKQAR